MNCGHKAPCGCKDQAFTTVPTFPCPGDASCPNPEPCSEFFDANCVIYSGPSIVDVPINTGDRLNSIIQKLILLATNPGCVTGGTCASVNTLSIISITNTSITPGWALVTDVLTYQVEYKLASSGVWILRPLLGPTATTDTITGLIPNEEYHIRVNATCTVGNCYSVTLLVETLA